MTHEDRSDKWLKSLTTILHAYRICQKLLHQICQLIDLFSFFFLSKIFKVNEPRSTHIYSRLSTYNRTERKDLILITNRHTPHTCWNMGKQAWCSSRRFRSHNFQRIKWIFKFSSILYPEGKQLYFIGCILAYSFLEAKSTPLFEIEKGNNPGMAMFSWQFGIIYLAIGYKICSKGQHIVRVHIIL